MSTRMQPSHTDRTLAFWPSPIRFASAYFTSVSPLCRLGRTAAFLLVVVFTCASSAAASWPGADKDPHPYLYVTAQDVA